MERDIETKEFRFKEKGHKYELKVGDEWRKLTGITTVLGVLAKPALISWAANETVSHIKNNANSSPEGVYSVTEALLEESRTAHTRKKEKAGDWGTEMHAWVELYINSLMNGETKIELPKDEKQKENAISFAKWTSDNKIKFVASEKVLYSKELFLGGIVDILCEMGGELWIADIKTSSGIYFEAFWQMAGYQILLEEMKEYDRPIKGHIVLNLKKDGTFEEKRSVSNEDNKKGFMACYEIYRLSEKVKSQIISN